MNVGNTPITLDLSCVMAALTLYGYPRQSWRRLTEDAILIFQEDVVTELQQT